MAGKNSQWGPDARYDFDSNTENRPLQVHEGLSRRLLLQGIMGATASRLVGTLGFAGGIAGLTACSPNTPEKVKPSFTVQNASNKVSNGPISNQVTVKWKKIFGVESNGTRPLRCSISRQPEKGAAVRIVGDDMIITPESGKNIPAPPPLDFSVSISDGQTSANAQGLIEGVNTLDTQINPIAFSPVSTVNPNTDQKSITQTISGLSEDTSIILTSSIGVIVVTNAKGEELNRGTEVSVKNGDIVYVIVKSSDQFSTTQTAVVSGGGVTTEFSVITRAEDKMPESFILAPRDNVDRNIKVISNPITVRGIDKETPISITGGGMYSVNGGAPTSQNGTVKLGDIVTVEQVSGGYGQSVSSTLNIGGVASTFVVNTMVESNSAPVIPTLSPMEVVAGSGTGSINLPVAIDQNNDTLTYSLTIPAELTSFVQFDPATRMLSWNASDTIPPGTYSLVYSVSDAKETVTKSFMFQVAPKDSPVSFTRPTVNVSGNTIKITDYGVFDADGTRFIKGELLDSTGETVIATTSTDTFTGVAPGTYTVRTSAEVKNKTTGVLTEVTNNLTTTVTVLQPDAETVFTEPTITITDNNLRVNNAGINDPDGVTEIRYKLVGIDGSEILSDNGGFTNLPAGNYTLSITAKVKNGTTGTWESKENPNKRTIEIVDNTPASVLSDTIPDFIDGDNPPVGDVTFDRKTLAGSYEVRILAADGQTVLATVPNAITANGTEVANVSVARSILGGYQGDIFIQFRVPNQSGMLPPDGVYQSVSAWVI